MKNVAANGSNSNETNLHKEIPKVHIDRAAKSFITNYKQLKSDIQNGRRAFFRYFVICNYICCKFREPKLLKL